MELEKALEAFAPTEPITPEISGIFNSLLDLAKAEKPKDPVLRRMHATEVDMSTFYLGSDALRSCGTTLAQLGQMLMAVEDPDEFEPPAQQRFGFSSDVLQLLSGMRLKGSEPGDNPPDEEAPPSTP
jgi:hypothetical protein